MNCVKLPRTLRSGIGASYANENVEAHASRKITVGCLIAVASVTGAKAQQPLAPVTVDAPVERKKPAASKPTPEQIRARNAVRRAAREKQAQQAQAAAAAGNAEAQAPDRDPYADPNAPYKANRLSSSKFPEPIVNTPRSITVLTKELLEDKNATSLKDVARTTPGVTLGTGEGGNAFGDRFFIRGFDARNDVFVDGIRDPAVSVRENFFTEQLEILKGPAATIDGRGTTGGALNIVTKQATNAGNFYNAETQIATDGTRRVTMDVNQVINPTLAVRVDAIWQNAGIAGRDYTSDDRNGAMGAVKWTPNDSFTVTANYVHTYLWSLPDFGVPYINNGLVSGPVTQLGVARNTYYGIVNRDFQRVQQDFGTLDAKYVVNDFITLENKTRDERAMNDYVGTIPEQNTSSCAGNGATTMAGLNPNAWTVCQNAQSRYQVANVVANQSSATFKFDTGPVQNTVTTGAEVSREGVSIDTYSGFSSETLGTPSASGSVGPFSVTGPLNYITGSFVPVPTGNPNVVVLNTQSGYSLWTGNYRDYVILNAGVRFDETSISAKKMYVDVPWSPSSEVAGSSGSWNYNLGALWKPIPITSLYWAYATASDPVGAELDGTSNNYGGLNPTYPGNQIFSPIESRAQEVGNKWELFDRRLLATIALFRTDVSNARELPTGATQIVQGAAYHVQGIDMGAQGNITDKWSIYTGVVLMKTRVDHSAVASNIGAPLAFIAQDSFNVLTKYQINDKLQIGGQATYRSAMYGGTLLAANQSTMLPSYWRFDGFLGGNLDKNWKWKLYANNIFNKLYYDAFYQSGAPFVLVAPGRSVGVELAAHY
jgi:catecholate siderophore receptor